MKESDIRPQELFTRYLALAREDLETFFAVKGSFLEVPCPACGCDTYRPGLEKLGFRYVQCDACETLYTSPRPSREQLGAFYKDASSVKFWSTHFFRETAAERRVRIFRPRAKLVRDLLAPRSHLGKTFVDIGAGYGTFLEEVRALGCFERLFGVEPGPDLAAICRDKGFDVIEKPAEAVDATECQADVATAFEVLEHVFSPIEFLAAARRLVRPGGLFLFTTLTVTGFDIQVLWEHSKSVHPPHHINLLSVEGMRRLVDRAGLRLVDLSTPGQLDVDIVANALLENPTLPVPRFVRNLLGGGEEARGDFQDFLRRHLLSSHILVVASSPHAQW